MMKASNLRWPSRQEIWSDLSAAQTRHYATAAALLEGGTCHADLTPPFAYHLTHQKQ